MSTETFGQVLRELRTARHLSLRDLGRIVNYSKQHIYDLERDRRRPLPLLAQALDDALCAHGRLVRVATQVVPASAGTDPSHMLTGRWRQHDASELADALTAKQPTPDNALQIAHEWLVLEPPQQIELRAGRRIGVDLVTRIEKRIHHIRLVDDHIGGQDTHAVAATELAATAELLRNASYSDAVGRRLLSAISELCQIAGWITSDAGLHTYAQRIYLAGARAAHAAADRPGAANNLSSLAYQISNVANPRDAVLLARSAYLGAKDTATPAARALFLERIAWAEARAGESGAAQRALGQVDEAYAEHRTEPDPIWTYWLSPQEVEVMRGRVWTELRQPRLAVPILEDVIASYGDDLPRETSLYSTWVAESLIYAGEVDRAAETALEALRLAEQAHSARASARIAYLRNILRPHRKQPAVREFVNACAEFLAA
jgi:transcriptional regulator with XRE-family HTH domain